MRLQGHMTGAALRRSLLSIELVAWASIWREGGLVSRENVE